MNLTKTGSNTIICRCYKEDALYLMRIYSRPDNEITIELVDTSSTPEHFQLFVIPAEDILIAPGSYFYNIEDNGDILETGRVIITDDNHSITPHEITDTFKSHAVE